MWRRWKERIIDAWWWCYRFRVQYIHWWYFKNCIRNLWYYFPVVWNDRDWDHTYLLKLMHRKLVRMEKSFDKYSMHLHADRDVQNIKKCRILCERIVEDEYYERNPLVKVNGKLVDSEQNDVDLLCDIMRKHLREWWY